VSPLLRYAAPTSQPTPGDNTASEGRADPHGIHWTRGAPPFDHMSLAAGAADLVALSTSRGTGGRRASGWYVLAPCTLSVVTGAGQTETYQGGTLQAGTGLSVEMTEITVGAGGVVVVFW
jgi:hypothetical protein